MTQPTITIPGGEGAAHKPAKAAKEAAPVIDETTRRAIEIQEEKARRRYPHPELTIQVAIHFAAGSPKDPPTKAIERAIEFVAAAGEFNLLMAPKSGK